MGRRQESRGAEEPARDEAGRRRVLLPHRKGESGDRHSDRRRRGLSGSEERQPGGGGTGSGQGAEAAGDTRGD